MTSGQDARKLKIIEKEINKRKIMKINESWPGDGASYFEGEQDGREVFLKVIYRTTGKKEAMNSYRVKNIIGSHPNIERLIGNEEIKLDNGFGVMTDKADENLQEHLDKNGGSEKLARTILLQGGYALQVVHQNGILHRDIKPSNLLRYKNTWVLNDFGASGLVDPKLKRNETHSYESKPNWSSPEMIAQSVNIIRKFDEIEEIFQFTALVYQVMHKLNEPPKIAHEHSEIKDYYEFLEQDIPNLPGTKDTKIIISRGLGRRPPEKVKSESDWQKYRYTSIGLLIRDLEQGVKSMNQPKKPTQDPEFSQLESLANTYRNALAEGELDRSGRWNTISFYNVEQIVNSKEEFINKAKVRKLAKIPKTVELKAELKERFDHVIDRETNIYKDKIISLQNKANKGTINSTFKKDYEYVRNAIFLWGPPMTHTRYTLKQINNGALDNITYKR